MEAKKSGKRIIESDKNQTGKFIPYDLIKGIIKRLPSKSIGRFKCLSKIWMCYLSDSEFINKHAIEAKENPNVFQKLFCYVHETNSLYRLNPETYKHIIHGNTFDILHNAEKMELPAREDHMDIGFMMVGSCNGLVCLQRRIRRPLTGETFFLLNPLTGESRQLFYSYHYPYVRCSDYEYLMIKVGFGYDSCTKDYKIVRFNNLHNKCVFDIFSLRNNCWRTVTIQTSQFPTIGLRRIPSVEVGGFLHWELAHSNRDTVFTFDLAKEKGREFILNVPNNDHGIGGLGVLDGYLCASVVESQNLFGDYNCVIWMMKQYGVVESWTPLIHLSLPCITSDSFRLSPICYTKKDKKDRLLLLEQNNLGFIYNLQDKSHSICWFSSVFGELTAGFETLISPNPFFHA